MQLWQLDVTDSVFLADGTQLKLISGLDDCSRFCVIATVVRRATARAVCRAFVAAMRLYGIPDEVLTDTGRYSPAGSASRARPAQGLRLRLTTPDRAIARSVRHAPPASLGQRDYRLDRTRG